MQDSFLRFRKAPSNVMTCLFIARVIDREEIEKEKREKEVGDLKSELMSHTEKQIDRVSSLLANNA